MGTLVELRLEAQLEAGGKQADAPLRGVAAEFLHRGGAELAPRGVDHAQEGGVIVRIHQQAQVGHDVLHLGEGEEGVAAGEGVGDLVLTQCLLEQA